MSTTTASTAASTATLGGGVLHISEHWSFCYMDIDDIDGHCGAADTAAAVRGKQMMRQQQRQHQRQRQRLYVAAAPRNETNFTDRVAMTLCWQCWSGLLLFCGGCQR